MKSCLKAKNFRWIFASCLLIIIIVSIYTYFQGREFDRAILADNLKLDTATSLAEAGNHNEAIAILEELDKKYSSCTVSWFLGSSYSAIGNELKARDYFEKARHIYPAIVFDTAYIKEYIELLVKDKDYERANSYINFYLTLVNDPQEIEWANEYLKEMGY